MQNMCVITVLSYEYHGISNHWQCVCLFNSLLKPTKKYQRSLLLALCEGNPPVTGGFPSQRASNMESIFMP